MKNSIQNVRAYWNSHLNCTQFLTDQEVELGSDDFYHLLGQTMERYIYKKQLFYDLANSSAGQKLLEVGCGLGLELAKLGKLGFDVTGIDLSPKAVGLSESYLRNQGIKGQTLVQNAENMDFPNDAFDIIYSSGVLQHTPNIDKAIAEIWRVLKPAGRILIVLYHRHSWFYPLYRISRINIEFQDQDAPIINTYTKNELKLLFSRFRDIEIHSEYYYPQATKRRGFLPAMFNYVFVPITRMIPSMFMKNFGWHIILTATK